MEHIRNLITVQDFAEQITQNISIGANKIYAMVREPGFPSVKIGGRYYVLADKIDEWLEEQSHKKD